MLVPRSASRASWVARTTSKTAALVRLQLRQDKASPVFPAVPSCIGLRFHRGQVRLAMAGAGITGGFRTRHAALLAAAGMAAFAVPAAAQEDDGWVAQEVVQQLPAKNSLSLNAALGRLGKNPRDVEALIDAGKAALAMGDADAAVGFFSRADQVSPGNPRVKAGLAGSLVRNENPFDAIPLFEEAERGGGLDGAFAADRALAYDLVGDNATAQKYYRQVLAQGANDEATRRLALSLAMSGDKQGAERTLAPLLALRDKPAFRTRAFALAIAGDVEGAVGIAHATLPQGMAAAMAPYLRYMPRLTRAQQAAAANFGHFPRASEIGRDDPRIARYTAAADAAAAAQLAKANAATGSSRARGKNSRDRGRSAKVAAATPPPVAPPEPPQVSREISAPGFGSKPVAKPVTASSAPVRNAPAPASPPPVQPAPQRPATALPQSAPSSSQIGVIPPRVPTPTSAQAAGVPAPSSPQASPSVTGSVAGSAVPKPPVPPVIAQPSATTPAPLQSAPAQPARPRVADAFGDFGGQAPEAAPTPGAVDIRKITPARPKPKEEAKPAKPAPPSHPSRIWVQLATGRNKDALGFDWRKMTREAPEQFRGKKPNVSASGQSNRLLAGPFPSEAAATTFITQLRRAKIDGAFVWTSPAGQVVDTLTTP